MGRFTKVAQNAFDNILTDAGVVLVNFDPDNPVEPQSEDILFTTTGGINPVCEMRTSDFSDDVDNVQPGCKEFIHVDGWDCRLDTTSLTFNADSIHFALGAADVVNGTVYKKIVPRRNLKPTDFINLWAIMDKANGGAVAVKLENVLAGSLSMQTSKNGKGTNSLSLVAHPSIENQDKIPMEFYVFDPLEDAESTDPSTQSNP